MSLRDSGQPAGPALTRPPWRRLVVLALSGGLVAIFSAAIFGALSSEGDTSPVPGEIAFAIVVLVVAVLGGLMTRKRGCSIGSSVLVILEMVPITITSAVLYYVLPLLFFTKIA